MNDLIYNIITEASLDTRIQDGVVDLRNSDHLQVVAEAMYDVCEDEQIVNEFVKKFMDEGKYPDRQAYNKDGWLVTFPSAEYKQKALKKGTHFSSDPTRGKGGMNLYYKKRGKQKRQTQQVASTTQQEEPATTKVPSKKLPAIAAPASTKPQGSPQPSSSSTRSARLDALTKKPDSVTPPRSPAASPVVSKEPTAPASKKPDSQADADFVSTKSAETPAIDVPVVTTTPSQYAAASTKFAIQRGWTSTPYGEYKDGEGNPVAVVGLSGEVVPIRNNDREEYKIFAEKIIPKA